MNAMIESASELVPEVAHADADPVQPGLIVADKYRVGELIAMGGMGVVHTGTHLELGNAVAIKFVRSDCVSNGEVLRRFLNEARVAAALRSDNVAKVLDAGWTPTGVPFIVMEHLQGRDLATRLSESGPLPIHEAARYVIEACDGLGEAHCAGLIHRDVKPENLFIVESASGKTRLKLLDFGVAAHFGHAPGARRMTARGRSVGSPNYMSPEQMTSPGDTDQRTDVWSLGAVLYELLTGVRAFDGATVPMVCSAVLNTQPQPIHRFRPEVSPALERIVFKCLEKDRDRRFDDVAQLSEALEPFASREEVDRIGGAPTESARRVPSAVSNSTAPVFADLEVRAEDIPKVPLRSRLAPMVLVLTAVTAIAGSVTLKVAPNALTKLVQPELFSSEDVAPVAAPLPPALGPSRGVVHSGQSAAGGALRAEREVEDDASVQTRPRAHYEPVLTPEEIEARRERYRAWIEAQGLTPVSQATSAE